MSRVSLGRITNIHNEHMWWDENPHATPSQYSQCQFSIDLWAEISGDCFISPRILPAYVSGKLEDISLNKHLHMWAQQDYVPSHFSLELHQWLSENYPGRWGGHRGALPVSWSSFSPDFSPLAFFLCSKSKASASKVSTREKEKAVKSNSTICMWNKVYTRNVRTPVSLVYTDGCCKHRRHFEDLEIITSMITLYSSLIVEPFKL